MIYFIPIDRESIKKNPNGGNTTYLQWINETQYQVLHTLTRAPYYFYNYKDIMVECKSCHRQFYHKHLRECDYDDEDRYGSASEVCPFCGEWECCELKFEQFDKSMLFTK